MVDNHLQRIMQDYTTIKESLKIERTRLYDSSLYRSDYPIYFPDGVFLFDKGLTAQVRQFRIKQDSKSFSIKLSTTQRKQTYGDLEFVISKLPRHYTAYRVSSCYNDDPPTLSLAVSEVYLNRFLCNTQEMHRDYVLPIKNILM